MIKLRGQNSLFDVDRLEIIVGLSSGLQYRLYFASKDNDKLIDRVSALQCMLIGEIQEVSEYGGGGGASPSIFVWVRDDDGAMACFAKVDISSVIVKHLD
jgi:hypothetical protein